MKLEATNRGFTKGEFLDGNGMKCSIQYSSALRSDSGMLWLGIHEDKVEYMPPEGGWRELDLSTLGTSVVVHNRMHLTQDNVKALLPLLTYFVEHGELP